MIPVIICGGATGRAVLYGRVERLPLAEEVVVIHGARMILQWTGSRGLFGLAAHGPEAGTRITAALATVSDTARQVLSVSDEAAAKVDSWPSI
jgi:hypothetical protein